MSEPEDGFLTRWSQRKRLQEVPPATEPKSIDPISEQFDQESETNESLPDPEPLPRIEDLTADSDISGFLRTGVPLDLQKAALRRAWSLDPTIRDYCGPADYAMDFNDPDSVPGFASNEAVELARKLLKELANVEQVPEGHEPSSSMPAPSSSEDEG